MFKELASLPQVIKNLRYRLYRENRDTSRWENAVRTHLGFGTYRASEILKGEMPDDRELEKIAEWCKCSPDDVGSAPIYPADAEGMIKENIQFLLSSLGRGKKGKMAESLGVRPEQVSRWKKGQQLPPRNTQRDLLRQFGLDPDLDLTSVPLFLANAPIHAQAQRDWLITRLQEMPNEELAPHFHSIHKLISPK